MKPKILSWFRMMDFEVIGPAINQVGLVSLDWELGGVEPLGIPPPTVM